MRDDLFDTLGMDYHTIANLMWSAGSQQFVFMPDARETRVTVSTGEATRGVGSFFLLGIEHILTGYDHLLFLLALILRGGNLWSLFKIITAFTIAHSITLALAALNIVMLPERLVEATIALSIAYVAAENLFMRKAVSHRWAVSFLFGLVHGFGFSNVLRELGLPKEGLHLVAAQLQSRRRNRSGDGGAGRSADSVLAAQVQMGAARGRRDCRWWCSPSGSCCSSNARCSPARLAARIVSQLSVSKRGVARASSTNLTLAMTLGLIRSGAIGNNCLHSYNCNCTA